MSEKSPKAAVNGKQPAEFTGRIESISVGVEFRFAVAGKKVGTRMFAIEGGEPAHFAAMTSLVTSSYLAGKKVHVTGVLNGNAVTVAREVRIGAKPKMPRSAKLHPKKLKPAPSPEPQAAPPAVQT